MVFDITRPLSSRVVVYPGDVVPEFEQEDRGKYLLTSLHMSTHSGTHIDAPSHYMKDNRTVDRIPAGRLIGTCRVLDFSEVEGDISEKDLEGRLEGAKKLIFRTSFSGSRVFLEDYPGLTPGAARLLNSAGVHCVGTDAPSIEGYSGTGEVHRLLLERGTVVIELLDLAGVPEGDYRMVALPLRLENLDGSPCRVLLFSPREWMLAWT